MCGDICASIITIIRNIIELVYQFPSNYQNTAIKDKVSYSTIWLCNAAMKVLSMSWYSKYQIKFIWNLNKKITVEQCSKKEKTKNKT